MLTLPLTCDYSGCPHGCKRILGARWPGKNCATATTNCKY